MTPQEARASAARTALPCTKCWSLDCDECVGHVEDWQGLRFPCPCAEAGHEYLVQ